MATILEFNAALLPRGPFDLSASYETLNFVESGGSGYVCLQPCSGIPVTNTAYWFKFVHKGDPGTPFTYADLTAEQKAELVHDATIAAQAAQAAAEQAAQKFTAIKDAIDALDPSQSPSDAIVAEAAARSAKDAELESTLGQLGPEIFKPNPMALTTSSDTMTIDTENEVIAIGTGSQEIYYASVSAGDKLHITATNDSVKGFRYGFTTAKPANGVAVTSATSISTARVSLDLVAPSNGYIVLSHTSTYFTDHVVTVSRSRLDEIDSIIYKVRDNSSMVWRKNYRVSTLGKSATANGYALSRFVYVLRGSVIGVKTGDYTFDYALWRTNSYDDSSNLIVRERDLAESVTISVDGWLMIALHETDHGTALTDEDAAQLVEDALDARIVYPITETIDNKVDFKASQELTDDEKSVARNNIGAAGTDALNQLDTKVSDMEANIFEYKEPQGITWTKGYLNPNTGGSINYKNALCTTKFKANAGSIISIDTSEITNLVMRVYYYNAESGSFVSRTDWGSSQVTVADDCAIRILVGDDTHKSDYDYVLPDLSYASYVTIRVKESKIDNDKNKSIYNGRTELVSAQRYVAEDWHLPFIDTTGLGQGANHIIPGTAKTWSQSGTRDLVQKNVWMYDGIHPYGNGTEGIMKMYARTIANQLARISPSYKVDDESDGVPSYWEGKVFCWLGTSIPAGNDPTLDISGATDYPRLVALQLGAGTRVNLARGSSMMRINSADGKFSGIPKSHFLRAATRSIAEADYLATPEVWAEIYASASSYGSAASESDVSVMKAASWETFLKPYLDGTNTMPDLFVIDHGHNDYAVKNGIYDWNVMPTQDNINKGLLVEDTYMTDNDYANLKLALNNDLSGISDLASFAVSLNRNCFIGAMNFLITVILRYNPYARIAIVSDYN